MGSIGDNIKLYRERANMSQEWLSQLKFVLGHPELKNMKLGSTFLQKRHF